MSRHQLGSDHLKIDFHEREFLKHVVEAAGIAEEWRYSPIYYTPSTGVVEFKFDVPKSVVDEAVASFVHDPHWEEPEVARFAELVESDVLSEEEQAELTSLQNKLLLNMVSRRM